MAQASLSPPPLLLRWQGMLAQAPAGWLTRHLPLLSGWVLCALMAGLPLVTRSGLSLLVFASGLLWLLWALRTPPGRIGAINGWLLVVLAVAVMATGFSPVPMAALKGLLKLVVYLGVYALARQLLSQAPPWWDRIVAALLAGELITSVIGIRQLYADTGALARWSDANSVARGHGADLQHPRQPQPAGGLPAADPAPGPGGPAALAGSGPQTVCPGLPGVRPGGPGAHLQPGRLAGDGGLPGHLAAAAGPAAHHLLAAPVAQAVPVAAAAGRRCWCSPCW